MGERFICIHGHFYQPPRENPWLESVEIQESARPFHDWNERVLAECYSPNAASRILEGDGKIREIVNNYASISFNFGPTLLTWIEQASPAVYQSILEADKIGRERFNGHGPAIAQVYNHLIMPLASRRDKEAQVLWGIEDFEKRFGRKPEGMWLSETAVNIESLEVLAENDIRFVILAPHQAKRVRHPGSQEWFSVEGSRIDPTVPYWCNLPTGRKIAIFFYDGPVSQELAFGNLLENGDRFKDRLMNLFPPDDDVPRLVHIATDGETYGHHHFKSEMALAYCLHLIEATGQAQLTVYGDFLERFPPKGEVEIIENSSWSCVHGIERWRSDCGCNSGMHQGWDQKWRAPLRESLDWLKERLDDLFQASGKGLFKDPWAARNAYISIILNRSEDNIMRFLREVSGRELNTEERLVSLRLLEMQRHAMLMFTSCGWFFDEISGIEGTQVLRYAARAIQLAEELGVHLEKEFQERLASVPTNIEEYRNGGQIYELFVKPSRIDLMRVAAHYAIFALFQEDLQRININRFSVNVDRFKLFKKQSARMAVGRARFISVITLEEKVMSFGAIHLGEHNVACGLREFLSDAAFEEMERELSEAFNRGETFDLVLLLDRHFGNHNFSLWHLFRDQQWQVLGTLFEKELEDIWRKSREEWGKQSSLIRFAREVRMPLPRPLRASLEMTFNHDILSCLTEAFPNLEKLGEAISTMKDLELEYDAETISVAAGAKILALLQEAPLPWNPDFLHKLRMLVNTLNETEIDIDLWMAQNLVFECWKKILESDTELGEQVDKNLWKEEMHSLGEVLGLRIE